MVHIQSYLEFIRMFSVFLLLLTLRSAPQFRSQSGSLPLNPGHLCHHILLQLAQPQLPISSDNEAAYFIHCVAQNRGILVLAAL